MVFPKFAVRVKDFSSYPAAALATYVMRWQVQAMSENVQIIPLALLQGRYFALLLDPSSTDISFDSEEDFISYAKTSEEISLICEENRMPKSGVVRKEGPWRVFKVPGEMPFDTVGVASRLTAPLAEAGISVLIISTFKTDYLLVSQTDFAIAIAVYERCEDINLI